MWLPKIDGRSGPKYQAIADSILDAIRAGDLGPGDRLPPQRELAWKLGVTVGTVTRAYLVGEQQGVLSGEVGRGTYVRRKPTPISNELLPRNLDNTLRLTVNASYSSDFETFLAEALRAIAEKKGLERLLHYMPAAGHPEHRALGAAWIARAGYQVPADQVFLTNGAQQALSVAMQVLTRPGEAILTEALTYTAVLDNARNLDRRLHGVAMDEDGVIPEALEAAAKTTGAKVVLLIPTLQNPTSSTMSDKRRQLIAKVVERNDLILIEDDVYGLLPMSRPAPIAARIPERTFYLTSASKSVAPGLRCGWLVVPRAHAEKVNATIYALNCSHPPLTHEVLRQWIEDGTADRMVAQHRSEAAARHAIAGEVLHGLSWHGAPQCFHVLLDLPAPWRSEQFVSSALARGIAVVPASSFAVDKATAPQAVRISIAAAPDRAQLRDALVTLRDLALRGPNHSASVQQVI